MDDTLRDTLFASNKQFRTPKHLVVDQVFDTSRNVPKIEHFL